MTKFFRTFIPFFRSFISFFRSFISPLGGEFLLARELLGNSLGEIGLSEDLGAAMACVYSTLYQYPTCNILSLSSSVVGRLQAYSALVLEA